MRPLGVGEVLDVAINLYFRHFGRLLAIAAVVAVPLAIVIFALDLIALQETSITNPDAQPYQIGDTIRFLDETRYIVISLVSALVSALAYLLITGATFRSISESYFDREAGLRASISFAARRAHSLLWLTLLIVLAVGLGALVAFVVFSFLAVIFAIWALVAWSLSVPALMVEDARGVAAMRRSFNLVSGRWWRTFGALVVGFVFIGLFQLLTVLLQEAVGSLAADSVVAYVAVLNISFAAATVLTAPLQAAIVTMIYYDLRVRREGLDIAVMIQRLHGAQSAPEVAASET